MWSYELNFDLNSLHFNFFIHVFLAGEAHGRAEQSTRYFPRTDGNVCIYFGNLT